jgi:hypothetical protein
MFRDQLAPNPPLLIEILRCSPLPSRIVSCSPSPRSHKHNRHPEEPAEALAKANCG